MIIDMSESESERDDDEEAGIDSDEEDPEGEGRPLLGPADDATRRHYHHRDVDDEGEPNKPTLSRWLAVGGPGLAVMLADTDAGCLLSAGQTGAKWGYTLVPLQFLLVPVIVMAQELATRLGVCTGRGLPELVRERYSPFWSWAVAACVALTCAGAVVSEVSAAVGVGKIWGVAPQISVGLSVLFLAAVALSGSYRRAEAVAVACGLFELVYLYTAWRVSPTPRQLLLGDGGGPDAGTLPSPYIVSAQIGATLMPWMFTYGMSSAVERRVRPRDLSVVRADCLVGGVLTQAIMAAVIVTTAGTVWDGRLPSRRSLASVEDMSRALTRHLGDTSGRVLFSLGMLGGAGVGAIVTMQTAAWVLGEAAGLGGRRARALALRRVEGGGRAAAEAEAEAHAGLWHYGPLSVMLTVAALACLSGANVIQLNVRIQVLNAAATPVVLFFLYRLSRHALPPRYALRGAYRYAVLACFVACSVLGLAGVGDAFY